jgi:U3 small nucleolar RNA-associated protein 4
LGVVESASSAARFPESQVDDRFLEQTLPSSFPLPKQRNSRKPTSLLSHLVWTHQTTLSSNDLDLYEGDVEGAEQEIRRLQREGVRLFGVGGVGSELVEWEWGGPGSGRAVGMVKVR